MNGAKLLIAFSDEFQRMKHLCLSDDRSSWKHIVMASQGTVRNSRNHNTSGLSPAATSTFDITFNWSRK